jgi:DNA transformation protein and related proteins
MAGSFPDYLLELFGPLGGVTMKRMFGGIGIRRNGLMFALSADDVLYFKADEQTIPAFQAEGCGPFIFRSRDGRETATSYWRAPDRLFDDPEAFADFAAAAEAAAIRASTRKRKR